MFTRPRRVIRILIALCSPLSFADPSYNMVLIVSVRVVVDRLSEWYIKRVWINGTSVSQYQLYQVSACSREIKGAEEINRNVEENRN